MKPALKLLLAHIIGTTLIALVFIIQIVPSFSDSARPFSYGLAIMVALAVIYWFVNRYLITTSGKTTSRNPYHHFFFSGTGVLTTILTIVGLLGALFVYFEHSNLFQALGLVVSIIWVVVFLRYFMWSVYHYNINYGLTDQDWEKIFEARKRLKQGLPVNKEDLEAPDKNPYRSQTFGLPPGTVRGMIAFTLLLGGLSLLIVSFGNEYYTGDQLALIRQQFEFFETAFLMMIAFYFGDKSLKYLQRRWTTTQGPEVEDESTPSTKEKPLSTLEMDDLVLQHEDWELEQMEDSRTPPLTQSRHLLSQSVEIEATNTMLGGFVQVRDNIFSKVLSDEEIQQGIEQLRKEEGIELSMPVLKAVVEVESSGKGHLAEGKPKILFEGHKFWYWLKQSGKTEDELKELQSRHPTILYPRWTTEYYQGGLEEHKRLKLAKSIDKKAAVYSASWGLFQMLGENLEHNLKNRLRPDATDDDHFYRDYEDFERKQSVSEYYHFLDFLEFIKTKRVKGTRLIDFISEKNKGKYDWESFAYGYNGRGYKKNQYDIKLQAAYRKYQSTYTAPEKDRSGFIPIIDAGHGGIIDGKYTTKGKQYRYDDGLEIFEGVINRKIGKYLIELLEEASIPYHNLTVDHEEDISLTDRVREANALYDTNSNYYFMSIHSNAASTGTSGNGSNAAGFEVWTSVGQTKSDELATVAAKWYKQEFPDFRFRQDMKDGDADKEHEKESESFFVLRKTKGPAFLVENLFYDNRTEAQFLLSEHGQRRIARCLFKIVQEIHQTYRA
uniref:N-acetylmuramoyl-L-alanine amidase n=1 Tax=Roseihalotalea indica TaxID=2867963 RepID=A0AA49GQF0_9BACT|nr:N-acetylmuramidase domain-containing protein [Tunicatimonas sp. TK19036]